MDKMIADTHAHLYYDTFKEDLPEVVQRALDQKLEFIINIGADLEDSKKAVEMELSQIKLYCSIGLHPHEATKFGDVVSIHKNIEELEKLYHTNTTKIVALGECGLDYHFVENPGFTPSPLSQDQIKILQKELFISQINLAKKLDLPIIIHCRDAWHEVFSPTLSGTTGVFHSFTSTLEDAKKALALGYYLSFSCMITYPKNEHLREVIKQTSLDKILTETDCPFLPPQQLRGQRNEPANVSEVVKVIAEVKGLSFEEVARATLNNAKILFKLP